VVGVEFEYTAERDGRLAGTGETFTLDADMVFKAIGQTFVPRC
jgi:dihydropyrimidine dehydrogenase (NAD+) subunit PreT